MKNVFVAISSYLGRELALPDEDREVVAYGLEVVVSSLINITIALLAGILLGILKEIVAVVLPWLLIRQLAGGAHCSTMWRCTLVSSLIIIVLAGAASQLAGELGQNTILLVIIVCGSLILWSSWYWAPADNPNKPVRSRVRRVRFRRLALTVEIIFILGLLCVVLFSGTLYAAVALAAALSMGALGILITPAGFRAMAFIDQLLGVPGKTLRRMKEGGEKIC